MIKIIFIDDQLDLWFDTFCDELARFDVNLAGVSDPDLVFPAIRKHKPQAILLDVFFGGENLGKEMLLKIKRKYPYLPVIIISQAMDKKIYDAKDFVLAEGKFFKDMLREADGFKDLADVIAIAIEKAKENAEGPDPYIDLQENRFLIGNTEKMQNVFRDIRKIAAVNSTVLITGESGTGKEVTANALHVLSKRTGKFLSINCTAIPDALFESELFGYNRGAFTGAQKEKKGLFELAHKGTIFLDEIGELPLTLQPKLLKAIEEKKVMRVGGTSTIDVDVRIVAATNRMLHDETAMGNFRKDLFHRLAVHTIELPPLRERKNDIPLFYSFFIKKLSNTYGKQISAILRDDVKEKLISYDWPGNIREFESAIGRAIVATTHNLLQMEDFKSLGTIDAGWKNDGIDNIIQGIINGSLPWVILEKELKKGSHTRNVIFRGLVDKWLTEKRKRPSFKELADLLKTTNNNIRQKFHEDRIQLTDWPKRLMEQESDR